MEMGIAVVVRGPRNSVRLLSLAARCQQSAIPDDEAVVVRVRVPPVSDEGRAAVSGTQQVCAELGTRGKVAGVQCEGRMGATLRLSREGGTSHAISKDQRLGGVPKTRRGWK